MEHITLGEAIKIVLKNKELDEDLLDDLIECFWKMFPYYLEKEYGEKGRDL